MKKILLTTALLMLLTAATASAEVTGEVLYTDIDTYINNEPIPCYVVDGYVAIKAEDLTHYGFNVDYDAEGRVLTITENAENTETTPIYYDEVGGDLAGTKYSDVYSSDIKTVYNGKEITSYNIDGITLIRPEDMGINAKFASDMRCLYLINNEEKAKEHNDILFGYRGNPFVKGWQQYYIGYEKNIYKVNRYTGEKQLIAVLPDENYENYVTMLEPSGTADFLNVYRDIKKYEDSYGGAYAVRKFKVNRFSGEVTETDYQQYAVGRH